MPVIYYRTSMAIGDEFCHEFHHSPFRLLVLIQAPKDDRKAFKARSCLSSKSSERLDWLASIDDSGNWISWS